MIKLLQEVLLPFLFMQKMFEVSPGTSLLWDDRYGTAFEDFKFIHSAVLIGSIISKPSKDLICINLGINQLHLKWTFQD